MKNASKHAETLRATLKKIAAKDRPPRPTYEPLVALVRGALSEDADDAAVDAAMERVEAEFVDLNELRVATELEVVDLLGSDFPGIEEKATLVRTVLHTIFDREHTMKLERLKEMKRAEARQYLRDLPMMTPFVEAYVALHAFEANAFPLDDSTHGYLVDEGVVEPEAGVEEAQQFLESNLKAEELYPAYVALRERGLNHDHKSPKGGKRDEKAKKKS